MASLPAAVPDSSNDRKLRNLARRLLRLRNARQRHFPIDATGVAWDLMLALFDADSEEDRITVGELVERSKVARTTTVRWLRQLERHGLVELSSDRHDKRLVRVAITRPGFDTMETLLDQAGLVPV